MQKRLDEKTQKAYKIDLEQFCALTFSTATTEITSETIEDYIAKLHQQYKPKTVRRKIASLKAFFHYLEYKNIFTTKWNQNQSYYSKQPLFLMYTSIPMSHSPTQDAISLYAHLYPFLHNSAYKFYSFPLVCPRLR